MNALLVIAKQPAAGQTKTRLAPPLTPAEAAALYECFLRDTLTVARAVSGVGLMARIARLTSTTAAVQRPRCALDAPCTTPRH